MYKYLIIGLALLIFGSAAYYFNSSTGSLLLSKAVTQTISNDGGVTLIQLFSANYECNQSLGCEKTTRLTLLDDTTFELSYIETSTTTPEETAANETIIDVAQGTWGVGSNGNLVLIIDKRASLTSLPPSIHAKIDTLKIKDFSKKKVVFSWMKNPTFKRTNNIASKDPAPVTENTPEDPSLQE